MRVIYEFTTEWERMRKSLTVAVVAASLMIVAGVAVAQEVEGFAQPGGELGAGTIRPGQIYGGTANSVIWMQAPEWTYGTLAGGSLYELDADGTAFGFHAFVGIGLDVGIGQNPRLQLSGGFVSGRPQDAQSNPTGAGSYLTLDGSTAVPLSVNAVAQLEMEHDAFDFGLRALTDFVFDRSVTFTPSVMVFGGGSAQDYRATLLDALPLPTAFQNFANQDLDVYQVGVEGTLAVTVTVSDGFALVLGGRGALVYLDAEMEGTDCLDASTVTPGCDGLVGATTVNDSTNRTTYRAGLFAGTTFDLGPNLWNATFGVSGSIDWVPYAAIDNPDFVGDATSRLTLRHKAQYAISATFTMPLN